jgi:hypothetical protein
MDSSSSVRTALQEEDRRGKSRTTVFGCGRLAGAAAHARARAPQMRRARSKLNNSLEALTSARARHLLADGVGAVPRHEQVEDLAEPLEQLG